MTPEIPLWKVTAELGAQKNMLHLSVDTNQCNDILSVVGFVVGLIDIVPPPPPPANPSLKSKVFHAFKLISFGVSWE